MNLSNAAHKIAGQDIAREALAGLTDKERVHFATSLLLNVTDPEACGPMRFAAGRIEEQANILMREAFERECG
ncbi:hypothetical protein [Thalassobius sp. I31.1]|uniref:hypothetical protein n=1 Tax=Thalassobius sp. I31.1 TaxID=2109912 RepID=UPI000D19E2B4|nr:hypothetical protein [Thalassobius sp. I31.1]